MSKLNDPYMQQLQQMINAQQAQVKRGSANNTMPPMFGSLSGGGGYNVPTFGSMLTAGDRVVLISGVGQSRDNKANPLWGKDNEYVAGTVQAIGSQVLIMWDNGMRNAYDESSCNIETLQNAPAKKKGWNKKVELDTTKLDKLVIDPEIKTEMIALLQQHKHGKKIFEEWGLGEVIEYGRGMTFMFHGPPGTGKTFGAKCIAKALGKELLIIGAAEIQSSEPGGANRAIQNAFKSADEDGKVLFIDECDSLIANRANLGMILASEINTLLTEIEKCEGVVILATNRISDMDAALERRLSLIIKFPMPNFEQRKQIWSGLLPKKMPLQDDVNVDILAEKELSGGLIKNVVLQAARLAIAEDAKAVGRVHFEKAISRTTKSQGLMGKDRIQNDGMSTGTTKSVNRKLSAILDVEKG